MAKSEGFSGTIVTESQLSQEELNRKVSDLVTKLKTAFSSMPEFQASLIRKYFSDDDQKQINEVHFNKDSASYIVKYKRCELNRGPYRNGLYENLEINRITKLNGVIEDFERIRLFTIKNTETQNIEKSHILYGGECLSKGIYDEEQNNETAVSKVENFILNNTTPTPPSNK